MNIRHAARVILLLALTVPVAAQNEVRYKVRLAPVPMDVAMRNAVAGRGTGTATLKGMMLAVNATFEGLRSPATAARLYLGPTMGLRGTAFADLMITKATSGTISGSITLTAEQVRALERSRIYLQVASEGAPDGNLWGWFVK